MDHIASISVHLSYEYFNTQAMGPVSGPGPVLGPELKQDRDQSSGLEMTGTRTGTGSGPGP